MQNDKKNNINLEEIKAIPIEYLMAEEGHEIAQITNTSIFYLSPLKEEKTASFSVQKSTNRWKDFGDNERSGDIIDLARKIWKTDFKTTIWKLAAMKKSGLNREIITTTSKSNSPNVNKIERVEEEVNNYMLLEYLLSRSISPNKVKGLVGEIYYSVEGRERAYYGLAFKNDKGGYEIRNKYYKGSTSPKYFTHIENGSSSITVFEGFIDYLSLHTFKPITTNVLVLNSCSFTIEAIPIIAQYKKAYLMLDNDKTGNFNTDLIIKNSGIPCKDIRYLIGEHKDVNHWLMVKNTLHV